MNKTMYFCGASKSTNSFVNPALFQKPAIFFGAEGYLDVIEIQCYFGPSLKFRRFLFVHSSRYRSSRLVEQHTTARGCSPGGGFLACRGEIRNLHACKIVIQYRNSRLSLLAAAQRSAVSTVCEKCPEGPNESRRGRTTPNTAWMQPGRRIFGMPCWNATFWACIDISGGLYWARLFVILKHCLVLTDLLESFLFAKFCSNSRKIPKKSPKIT